MNVQIVDLLLGCQNFSPEAYAARELRHGDGRLFTAEEHQLVGKATRAELQAVRDYWAKAAEYHSVQHTALGELTALLRPYFERFGSGATVGELRPLMTPEDRTRLDDIASRIGGL